MMPKRPSQRVMHAARKVTRRLVSEGADAVVVVGSRVRGDSYRESDVDVTAIGQRNAFYIERIGGYLFSIAWRTPAAARKEFRDPSRAGGAVPGWRSAFVLHDAQGVAKAIMQEANVWTWDVLGKRREAWVAEEFTGWAEEVHRLVGNLEKGRLWAAGIIRSVLAIRLAPIMAVHHCIMYDTENNLWDLVGKKMGIHWSQAQSAALSIRGESLEESCKAALRLFVLAARELRPILGDRRRVVVDHACELAGRTIIKGRGTRANLRS